MVNRAIRNVVASCALLGSLVSFTAVGQAPDKKATHQSGSSPVSGLQLYKRYCAVCHGNNLKGNGPISPEYKNPPSDLVTLAQRHQGKFPDEYVEDVLRNGVKVPPHEKTEMPVGGPLFASTPGTDTELTKIRIVNLTNYIKSMQAK
ncbi:MAG: cytochrome c [Candidatus Acidiferrales bacterium]